MENNIKDNTAETVDEALKARIATYKAKHGRIFMYKSEDDKSCILRTPTLLEIDACRTISGGSSVQMDIALVDNCWLEGDEEFKTSDTHKMGLYDWLGGLILKVRGELEEL